MTDSQQFQDTAHDYMHAMRAPGQNADEAASLAVSFIADKLVEFKSLMSAGQTDKAYEALGMAMHPLMDATSPSHEGYQVWKGLFPVIDGTTYNAEMHRRRETKDVFNSNSDYSSGSVDAIRSLYDNATR